MTELAKNTQEDIEYPIIKVQEPEYCKLKVHFEADPEVVEAKIEEAMVELRKVKIPGFRKGKASDSAIKVRLRPQINQYIARSMVTEAMDAIQFETDCKPIGQPIISNITIKGNNFSCDIELNKKPEFELQQFKFEIPKPAVDLDEEALAEKSLFNLRLRVGEVEPYEEDDFVELGDDITFSFTASIQVDGKSEAFDGSVVEGEMYSVGSDRWNGFDDNLLGMKAGETRKFDFTFDNGPEEILGKTAAFEVTVHMGTKKKPHPLNDDFYKLMGVQNIEELLEKLRTISKSSIKRSQQSQIRGQVAIRLIEANQFEVPKFLVDGEAKYIAAQSGIPFDQLTDEEKKPILDQAEKSIRLTLILDTIREKEPDSVLNDNEAQHHIVKQMQEHGQNPAELFNNPVMHQQIMMMISSVKDEFTLQWVANQATIIE